MSSSSPTDPSAATEPATSVSKKRPAEAASVVTHPQPPPRNPRGRPPKKPRPPKSTITQLSTAAATSSSSLSDTHWTGTYDTVLAESEALLEAASQAQQLGRLRLATSYLWLLQARLVPLGKRLDAAQQQKKNKTTTTTLETEDDSSKAEATDLVTSTRATVSSSTPLTTDSTVSAASSDPSNDHKVYAHAPPGLVPILPAPSPKKPQVVPVFTTTMTTSNTYDTKNDNNNDNDKDDDNHQRTLGRGRKPDTTPLYTAPHAECNIKALMRHGQQLQQDQAQLEQEIQTIATNLVVLTKTTGSESSNASKT